MTDFTVDSEKKANVKSLAGMRSKKEESEQKEKRKPRGQFEEDILKLIKAGKMERTYGVVEEIDGTKNLVQIFNDKHIKPISETAFISDLMVMCNTFAEYNDEYFIIKKDAESIYQRFFHATSPIKDPKPLAFKSYDGYCYRRLDFDYDPSIKDFSHPTWDIILNNIESNKSAFMQFIGSIFFEESYNQQYLWLYGSGGDGKGTLLKYLSDILGNSCKSMTDDIDAHWTSKLVGARVAYFGDCRNYGITNTGKFMTLTGGDAIAINRKYKEPFDIKNVVKFIFASNNTPKLDHVVSAIRRVIIVPFRQKNTADLSDPRSFENGIREEGLSFIQHCMNEYMTHCNNHAPINHETGYDIEKITSEGEASKQAFLDQYFALESEEREENFVGFNRMTYAVLSKTFELKFREHFGVGADSTIFKNWMRDRHNIIYKQARVAGKKGYYYFGIRLLIQDSRTLTGH